MKSNRLERAGKDVKKLRIEKYEYVLMEVVHVAKYCISTIQSGFAAGTCKHFYRIV
jgi:hypothetical protein